MFGSQTDFELQSMSCIKVRTAQNLLLFSPSVTDQTHILLTHCTPARLSWNSYIWHPTWREQRVLIKYSQNYHLFIFVFNSTEVRTETLTILCVLIPLLVDTWPEFGLFRVKTENRCTGITLKNHWCYEKEPHFCECRNSLKSWIKILFPPLYRHKKSPWLLCNSKIVVEKCHIYYSRLLSVSQTLKFNIISFLFMSIWQANRQASIYLA